METPRGVLSRHNWCRCVRWRPFLSFLLVLAGLAGTSATSFAQLSPGGPVDFGGVPVNQPGTPITLTFSATVVTTVTSIVATTDGASGKDYVVTSQNCTGTLMPPASCQITVSFTPSAIGLRRGELLIYDGASVLNRAALHGEGLGPQLVLSPGTAVATTTVTGVSPTTLGPSSTVLDGAGDLFIDDAANGRVLEQAAGSTAVTVVATVPGSPLSTLTIAGDGTLFISSPAEGLIYALPPGGTAAPYSLGSLTLSEPTGIATDGFGFLYIVDKGNNRLVRVNLDSDTPNGTALTLTGLGTALSGPTGLSIDAGDNAYIADTGNNRIVEVALRTAAASIFPISGETLSGPTGVAVNAAGGLTISDTGNSRLVEAPLAGSAFVDTFTGATLSKPAGITLLPTGDLLVSDTVAGLIQITRSAASVTFPTDTLVGTIDTTDGNIPVTAENSGSYVLQLPSAPDPGNLGAFFAAPSSTCPVTTSSSTSGPATQIGVGAACVYEFGFKPTVKGTNSATATISATAVVGSGAAPIPSTVSPTVSLTGTGYVVLSYFTLVISPSSVSPGQSTTLTITAYNNDGSVDTTYTGTVTLSSTDPAANFPPTVTFTAAGNGVAVVPVTFNTLGTWTITGVDTVTVPGKTITGTSNVVTVTTTPTVTLTSSVNPVNINASTILTVTVSSSYGTPTGTVTVMDGGTPLGTINLTNGTGTLTVSFSTAGQHTLTAVYPGAGFFLAATSAPLIENVEQFTPTVSLTSSVNPVAINASTILTATVSSTSGTPTGTVTFMDGTTPIGTGTLNNGVATLSTSFSTIGQHTLTAVYGGVSPFLSATSAPYIENVIQLSTTITLNSSVNPVMLNNTVQLTATITSTSGTPTGTVTFFDGSTPLGTANLISGTATLSVAFNTTGQHILTAVYAGVNPYQPATSAPLTENVGDFALTLASTSSDSATLILGGTTTFNLNVAPVGTSTLAGPVALNVTNLPAGGSGSFAPPSVATGSGSTPVAMTITAPPLFTTSSVRSPRGPASWRPAAPAILALLLLPIGALARRRKPIARLLILLVGLGALTTSLTGCLSNDTTGYYAQPPQTYTLTVSGTSGSLVHSLQVTITVE
jgi:hypothetical protein